MKRHNSYHPKLKALFPIAQGIAATFEKYMEVVIHDLTQPENSLIFIAGNVTGRKIGAPITNIILETLKQKGDQAPNLIGYQTTTKDGKILKSSTIFIRDDEGKIIGCLCINFDLTDFLTCREILDFFTKTEKGIDNNNQEEKFFNDVNEAMEEIVQSVLDNYPTPKKLMEKEDKLVIVRRLDEKGVFLVKGAIDYVANILGVSRYTIYNYLDEVRSNPNLNIIL